VGGKDARYDASDLTVIVEVAVVAFEVEVKGGRAPEVSPPGGEDLGAGAIFRGEEGDDFPENGVGEGADVVDASSAIFTRSGRRTASGPSPRRPRFRAARSGRRRFPLPGSSTGRIHLLVRLAKEMDTDSHTRRTSDEARGVTLTGASEEYF
jgi:hypothetical protein